MSHRRFPILGVPEPPMLGREAIMRRILSALTKPTPDHLQVVGARYAGKTVILHELARRLRQASAPYSAIVVWDLGHQTPATDEIFMQRFARELSGALKVNHEDYANHLKNAEENPYQDIADVLDALRHDDGKVLAIMDGFDKPLSNGRLTRNLWDQLRELALRPGLRMVTASRSTLRDLIRHPEAQTSDFWNIFEPAPVRVGCFDDDDLIAVLGNLPDLELTGGAKSELWKASNGFPIIMLEILNTLYERMNAGSVSLEAMRAACDSSFPALRDKIDAIWTDCKPSTQDLFRHALDQGTLTRAGIAHIDAEALIERGFIHDAANTLQRPSHLLGRYLEEQPNESSALVRLFGMPDRYNKNFKGVLERRVAQITGIDPSLRRYIDRCAEDLPDHPDVFMTNIRGIVDRSFDLIWRAELDSKAIPSAWMSIWKYNKERGVEDFQTTFPQGVRRIRLLNLMTGTDKSKCCAKYVTKATYVLINATHAFGDFGQHQEGAPIDASTAYSAFHLCIELAAALARELP